MLTAAGALAAILSPVVFICSVWTGVIQGHWTLIILNPF
jgi:hypothetical protein